VAGEGCQCRWHESCQLMGGPSIRQPRLFLRYSIVQHTTKLIIWRMDTALWVWTRKEKEHQQRKNLVGGGRALGAVRAA
jgi:hypothetical protein